MHVLDRLLVVEVHPERVLEWGRVFLDGAVGDFPMRREGRNCSPMDISLSNCWRVSGADTSAISLEVYVWYVRCL